MKRLQLMISGIFLLILFSCEQSKYVRNFKIKRDTNSDSNPNDLVIKVDKVNKKDIIKDATCNDINGTYTNSNFLQTTDVKFSHLKAGSYSCTITV